MRIRQFAAGIVVVRDDAVIVVNQFSSDLQN